MTIVEASPEISVEDEITIDWEPKSKRARKKTIVKKSKASHRASHRRSRVTYYLPFALLFQVLYLLPSLRTGWLGDDGLGYNYKSYLQFEHLHFWSDATQQVTQWIAAGRFYPVLFYQGYGVFYWVHSEAVYKAMIVALTAAASATFYLLLRRLRLSPAAAALAIVVATCCIQLRDYHDAILSYDGFIQILLIELCGSLLLLDTWMKRGGWKRSAAGSTMLFAIACATYELAYVFGLFCIAIALNSTSSFKRRITAIAPTLLTSTAFSALALYLRAISTHKSDNYTPNYDSGVLASTFGKQELGMLPGTFQMHAKAQQLDSISSFTQNASHVAVALGIAALVLTAITAWRSHARNAARPIAAPITLAVMLMVLPALPLMIAPKYQNELEWGWAYLPVLFQVFGFGLLLATLVQAAIGRRAVVSSVLIIVLAVSVGISTAYDGSLNQLTATDLAKWKALRHAQQSALQSGMLKDVADNSVVFASPAYYWETTYFFYRYTDGKRFDARMAETLTPAPTMEGAACTSRNDVAYVFESRRDREGNNPTVALKCFPSNLLK